MYANDKQFRRDIREALDLWQRRYVPATRRNAYYPVHYDYTPGGDNGEEEKDALRTAEAALAEQVRFIRMYVGMMYCDGDGSRSHLGRIKHFLALQLPHRKPEPEWELTLCGGCMINIPVFLDSLDDFDFADALSMAGFQDVTVAHVGWRVWSKNRIAKAIQTIKNDISFDGIKARLIAEGVRPGGSTTGALVVNVRDLVIT